MDWQQAPDKRALRTLDWMNDACEAALGNADRADGKVSYRALMSPIRVEMRTPRRVLGVRLAAKGRVRSRGWPIAVLITDSWLLVGTQRRFLRWAKVDKFNTADLSVMGEGLPAPVSFEFAIQDEVNFIGEILAGVTARRIGTSAEPPDSSN